MARLRLLMFLVLSVNAGIFIKAAVLPRSYTGLVNIRNYDETQYETTQKPFIEISEKDLHKSINFGNSVVNRLQRLETNLARSDVLLKKGTPSHGLFIDSSPEKEALRQGKQAIVVAKATMHLMNSYCKAHNLNSNECAKQMSKLKLSSTILNDSCKNSLKTCSSNEMNAKYRNVDGSCNHKSNGNLGKSFTSYKRLLFPSYLDGIQEIRRSVTRKPLPSSRLISNKLVKNDCVDHEDLTLSLVQWTEFIGNDLAHTATSKMVHVESSIECCATDGGKLSPRYVHPFCEPISIPLDDHFYSNYNMDCMSYVRSLPSFTTECTFGPYEQMNQATHYLDASSIYGSDLKKMLALREMKNGLLRTTKKNGVHFLPLSDSPAESCQQNSDNLFCFLSGDMRVNLHPHLTAIVTIWHREHNRLAKELSILNPNWNDDTLFNEARRIVIAEMQHITYNEWLPVLLGSRYVQLLNAYEKYDENVDPSVSNAFATAALRFIKSMVDEKLQLYKDNREVNVTLQLRNHFNKPNVLEEYGYIDGLIRGLATQSSKALDLKYAKDLTQHLYGNEKYGMDVLSLDIQRGRDHGLPSYIDYRKLCGLTDVKTFQDFLGEMTPEVVESLEKIYDNPADVDLIVGGISEKADGQSILGPTFSCIIADQMLRTRKGDRYYYLNPKQPSPFTKQQIGEIKKVTLARIFCDNGDDINRMQPNVFKKISTSNKLENCDDEAAIPKLNLKSWSYKY